MTFDRIDVADLTGRPGASRDVVLAGAVEGPGSEIARPIDDVRADLRLDGVVEGVLVSGRIEGTYALRCARCLAGFDRPFTVDVSELFVATPSTDDVVYGLSAGSTLDPAPMVIDAIGLDIPFAPLCRPDCRGLCEVCGADRNLGGCDGHDDVDPRWRELDVLLQRLGEPNTG